MAHPKGHRRTGDPLVEGLLVKLGQRQFDERDDFSHQQLVALKTTLVGKLMTSGERLPTTLERYIGCPPITKELGETRFYPCLLPDLCPYCRVRRRIAPLLVDLYRRKKKVKVLDWWSVRHALSFSVPQPAQGPYDASLAALAYQASALFFGFRAATKQQAKDLGLDCVDAVEFLPSGDWPHVRFSYTVLGTSAARPLGALGHSSRTDGELLLAVRELFPPETATTLAPFLVRRRLPRARFRWRQKFIGGKGASGSDP